MQLRRGDSMEVAAKKRTRTREAVDGRGVVDCERR